MKNYLVLLIGAMIFFSCSSSDNDPGFHINGTIAGIESGTAVLKKLDLISNTPVDIDTVEIKDGSFELSGYVDQPYPHSLIINDSLRVNFFLENNELTMDIDTKEGRMDVAGSSTDSLFQPYWAHLEKLWTKADSLQLNRLLSKSPEEQKLIDSLMQDHSNLEMLFSLEFIAQNPKSYVAPFAAFYFVQTYEVRTEGLEEMINSFDASVGNSVYLQELRKLLDQKNKLAPGQPAPDFALLDITGQPHSLKDFNGKLVLLDFWASWCKPCREKNPFWKDLYENYKEKGFTIVSISLDTDRNAWINAVEQDGLTWTQLSSLDGWATKAAEDYGVKAIPHNFLIGFDGNIIGHQVSIPEMRTILESF